ncbi:MAG TPA: sirohydrochlorin chelatase [Actinopolymorphaceae bacterium]
MSEGLLLVAHGSRDPRASEVAHEVARAVARDRPGLEARAAFLELAEPDPATALDDLVAANVRSVTVVPFLLGHAYHAKVDLPKVVEAAKERALAIRLGSTLGPDPRLCDLLARRLEETGAAFDAIVLAAAGSSDPDGNAGVFALAEQLSSRFGVPVSAGFASATQPDVEVAVRLAQRAGAVAVATYLLAPGYFADKIRRCAEQAGAVAVSAPLGVAPEIVALVRDRT